MSIDWWTLGLQLVNVLVLIWLLSRFFWRPVAAMIAQRQAIVDKALADAAEQKQAAEAEHAKIAETRASFAEERHKIIDEARQQADALAKQRLDAAAAEIDAMKKAAAAAIAREAAETRAQWAQNAGALAADIARHLLAGLESAPVRQRFADRLVAQISALPDAERADIADGAGAIEAVTASALSADEQKALGTRLSEALGAKQAIRFRTDPDLIAGLELRGPHVQVRNSWRDDIETILHGIGDSRHG